MNNELGIGILCILCVLLGGVAGAFIGAKTSRRRDIAPAPVDLGYDPDNPMNAGHREYVDIGGVRLWRM